MQGKVFLCYRRDDSAPYAGRIQDRLVREFGRDLSFMDVDAVPLGLNFVKVLNDEVAKCDVLLALIGPKWLDARNDSGNRRLDDPNDFVRIEIGAALQRNIPVIPILLDGASIPKPNQLPEALEELALRNGLDVRHASFHNDLDRLIQGLKKQLVQSSAPRKAYTLFGRTSAADKPANSSPLKQAEHGGRGRAEAEVTPSGPTTGFGHIYSVTVRRLLAATTALLIMLAAGYGVYYAYTKIFPINLTAGLNPNMNYQVYDSEKLGIKMVYPKSRLMVDTTQEAQGRIPLITANRQQEVLVTRTPLPDHKKPELGQKLEREKLESYGYTFNYDKSGGDWYILSGEKPNGSEFYYRRWYTSKDVVSIEFDYPKDVLNVYHDVIDAMTLKGRFQFTRK